ncbi:formate/nitrite transporter family protein [Mycobacteroides chelonae]|uniref:formate/nitrite transporter family protein n=1 Tax=Mycobacteroides chelonae TaxID=1774 RepID=UPI0008AA323D|nr:formate/nitrite transporter family protein [Mycobacteroides chelonae]AYM42285.1 formate/nitrite transporter family protein [[Mycobacterium] chelonae subsp. gwanakae]OHU17315.1 formate transporter [Mycobacteroides chelonae]
MTYVKPPELAQALIDAGELKIFMSTRDTLIRAYMAGAMLTLAAAFAVKVTVDTGSPILGAALFPVGFCLLYLLGYDLLTGVFVLAPLAYLARRPGVTTVGVLRNWGLVFLGNFAGALTVAVLMAVYITYGFDVSINDAGNQFAAYGQKLAHIGSDRTLGYADHGVAGWLTVFVRGMLCNWMVSTGVVGALLAKDVVGKVLVMWMPIMLFFAMGFEHSVVNMFLFPIGILLGADFTWADYFLWNEFPTALGNLVGGLFFTGVMIYLTHYRTAPKRNALSTTKGNAVANA